MNLERTDSVCVEQQVDREKRDFSSLTTFVLLRFVSGNAKDDKRSEAISAIVPVPKHNLTILSTQVPLKLSTNTS